MLLIFFSIYLIHSSIFWKRKFRFALTFFFFFIFKPELLVFHSNLLAILNLMGKVQKRIFVVKDASEGLPMMLCWNDFSDHRVAAMGRLSPVSSKLEAWLEKAAGSRKREFGSHSCDCGGFRAVLVSNVSGSCPRQMKYFFHEKIIKLSYFFLKDRHYAFLLKWNSINGFRKFNYPPPLFL